MYIPKTRLQDYKHFFFPCSTGKHEILHIKLNTNPGLVTQGHLKFNINLRPTLVSLTDYGE